MKRLPKLVETWIDGNITVEIYEETGGLKNNPHCEITFYKLRIIHEESRKFPVLPGAINEAKRILTRKNHRKLQKINTDFDLNGKNEKDQ